MFCVLRGSQGLESSALVCEAVEILECNVVITRCTLTVDGWLVAVLQLSYSGGQLPSEYAAA